VIEVSIFMMYAASYAVVLLIIEPLQISAFSGALVGSILFLPHGVRVVATWLFRERAILPLILAEFIITTVFWKTTAGAPTKLVSAIIGGSSAYIVLRMLEFAGMSLSFNSSTIKSLFNWRAVIFVAIVASFINSFGKVFVLRGYYEMNSDIGQILGFLVGDTLGAFVTLCLAMLYFRYRRWYTAVKSNR